MSLVFAAITPHSPLLIPAIGKDKIEKIRQTKDALERLEEELYASRPHLIIVISPHTSFFPDAFCVNAHNQFTSNYEEFGDLMTKRTWIGSPDFAAHLQHSATAANVPLQLVSEGKIDHGASVPLFYLTNHLPDVKVLPMGFSNLSPKDHLVFGELLKEKIMETDKRVAIIASGDLSHTLSKDAPGGHKAEGKEFDRALQQLLEAHSTMGLVGLDEKLVTAADQCGYRSILILLGVLKKMDYSFKNLAYEAPFGVGYLTGQFLF